MKQINLQEKVTTYLTETGKLAVKLKLQVRPIVNWQGGKPNWLGRIALYLLIKSGAVLDTQFTNLEK